MGAIEEKLISLYHGLDKTNQEALLAFAEFLGQRGVMIPKSLLSQAPPEPVVKEPPEKHDIPRPEEERVVAAIKRLSKTYPTLDKRKMLNETSGLVTAHIVQGRDMKEVIDELEDIFLREFELLLAEAEEE